MAYQASELGSDDFEEVLDATLLVQVREKIRSTDLEVGLGAADEPDRLVKECGMWERAWIEGTVGDILPDFLCWPDGGGYTISRSDTATDERDQSRIVSANRLLVFMAVMHSIRESFSPKSGLADDASENIFDSQFVTVGVAKLAEARNIVGFDRSGALGVLRAAREGLALPVNL